MRLEGFNWSAPAIAMVVGVGLGLLLVFTRGMWKTLPGWVKFLFFLIIVALFVMFALGRLPIPF
jgi:hypothetical protein